MNVDLASLLTVNESPLELVLRGTMMYWFLLLIFRFVLRRDPGAVGVADILFVVIIADASQNAMSGSYDTVAEGFILVGTLVFWNFSLDWASYRWKLIHKLIEPAPVPLIREGRVLARNLRKEYLTREDLDAQLRQAGVDNIGKVRAAYLESDGKFSVVLFQDQDSPRAPDDKELPGAE